MVQNLGGRITLNVGDEVRYLDVHSCVSRDIYVIDAPHTDFRARARLKNGDTIVNTHYDRILPVSAGGKAVAVFGDKKVTITCPECHKVTIAELGQTNFTCCSTLEVFFMSEATQEVQNQESQKFDLKTLLDRYEVWVKEGAKFNESINLTTVQLVLLEGETPRKMSFNLYDGKLSTGGKKVDLRLEEFFSGCPTEGKKEFWYKVEPTKYQKVLENNGYRKL